MEKLKVYECKAYLRIHKLRLGGKKEELLNRIRDHIEYELHPLCYLLNNFVISELLSLLSYFLCPLMYLKISCDSQTFRVKLFGDVKYPVPSFVLNCKGEKKGYF